MDWKRIAPWNWFKDEESAGAARLPGPSEPPSDPLLALRSELERLLFPSHSRSGLLSEALRPSVDISEGKKAYTVRAEIPGVELEDVSIDADGKTLVIRAEKRDERDEEEEGYHCVERSYGAVQRVLSLPDDADSESIDARFKNGVLTLRIAKHTARAARGRQIEIQRG